MAKGYGGQDIIVWSEQQMVIVITDWDMQQPDKPQEIVGKYIYRGYRKVAYVQRFARTVEW